MHKSLHPRKGFKAPIENGIFLDRKIERLQKWLGRQGGVLVAWSGGVDSTFLAVMAHQALGERALAVTADSPLLDPDDLRTARRLARSFGMRHRVIRTAEMKDPTFVSNPPDRCYHCKQELFGKLRDIARAEGLKVLVDGTNVDDRRDYRPGVRAAREYGVVHPLQRIGFRKEEIREASRRLGLPTADKPAAACLASRFPYGTRLSLEGIRRVAAAERTLRRLGFPLCRVRAHDEIGRVEIPLEAFGRALEKQEAIVRALHRAGFLYVTLDLEGYRTGSLNAVLKKSRVSAKG